MTSQFEYFCYGTPASAFEHYEPGQTGPRDDYWGTDTSSEGRPIPLPVSVPGTQGNTINQTLFSVAA